MYETLSSAAGEKSIGSVTDSDLKQSARQRRRSHKNFRGLSMATPMANNLSFHLELLTYVMLKLE